MRYVTLNSFALSPSSSHEKKKILPPFPTTRGSAPRIAALIAVTREFDNAGSLQSAIYRYVGIVGTQNRRRSRDDLGKREPGPAKFGKWIPNPR